MKKVLITIANLEHKISLYAQQEIEKHMRLIATVGWSQEISTPIMLEQLEALRDDIASQMPHFGREVERAYNQIVDTLKG